MSALKHKHEVDIIADEELPDQTPEQLAQKAREQLEDVIKNNPEAKAFIVMAPGEREKDGKKNTGTDIRIIGQLASTVDLAAQASLILRDHALGEMKLAALKAMPPALRALLEKALGEENPAAPSLNGRPPEEVLDALERSLKHGPRRLDS